MNIFLAGSKFLKVALRCLSGPKKLFDYLIFYKRPKIGFRKKHFFPENTDAIIFIHGFTGGDDTWSNFPAKIARVQTEFNIYSYAYDSSLIPDTNFWWSCNPDISGLAKRLVKIVESDLDRYDNVVIVAHSMGGLVVQEALIDSNLL